MASVRGAITCLFIALLSPKEGKAEQLSKWNIYIFDFGPAVEFSFFGRDKLIEWFNFTRHDRCEPRLESTKV